MAKYLEDIRVLGGTVSIGSLTSSNTDNLFEVDGDSAVIGSLAVGTYSNTPGYVFDARGDINIGKNGVNTKDFEALKEAIVVWEKELATTRIMAPNAIAIPKRKLRRFWRIRLRKLI